MMKGLIFLFVFISCTGFGQDASFSGTIGEYPIEVVFQTSNYETGELTGKYRYVNKEKYLQLKGQLFEGCVFLEEFYKEKKSGTFYLERNGNFLMGKWISAEGTTSYDASFSLTDEGIKKIAYKTTVKRQAETNKEITGTYRQEEYFLNDMWFSEETPSMEIGFNGGNIMLEELSPDSIHFLVEVVCGPTYHIAYSQGIAVKQKGSFYQCVFTEEKDTCTIKIELKKREAHVWAESTSFYVCEFGARAYLDHHFLKVSDTVDFGGED